jgi:sterol desaturase/sphingolipid hydroxylase (fatty acid hydroxylase superfamily)
VPARLGTEVTRGVVGGVGVVGGGGGVAAVGSSRCPRPTIGSVKDLTVVAIPVYFGSMGAEYLWQRNRQDELSSSPGVYERRDTVASLTMGVGSLLGPLVMPKLLKNVVPGKGKYAKALVGTAVGAAVLTTAADAVVRAAQARRDRQSRDASQAADPPSDDSLARLARLARPLASAGGVVAIAAGGVAVTTSWQSLTSMRRFARRRLAPARLPSGLRARSRWLAPLAAIFGWDFIYYWNHRAMHESRFMWAIHVVHHSSERYNLSTALRQPVADALGTFAPYGLLTLLGVDADLIEMARGVNLVYQFWIHTEAVEKIGRFERVLNTPSHHRVHHGSNGPYLDRNHGSILIVWDKLFGTFEPEGEQVIYGLTKNVNTFNPLRIATHEYAEMFKDVARSDNWRDRLSFVVRGPGWAGRRRLEMLGGSGAAAGGGELEGEPAESVGEPVLAPVA